ncbi:hypothetical protein ABES25_04665 [Bacillus gobiensis]|uniref:hypothetical protein n=1 Tax=Bacillus gobiensis TaxID=1441095 RepID=UPI003D1D6FE0
MKLLPVQTSKQPEKQQRDYNAEPFAPTVGQSLANTNVVARHCCVLFYSIGWNLCSKKVHLAAPINRVIAY